MNTDTPPEDDNPLPDARSSGNQGARGSRGAANDGALSGHPDSLDKERAAGADDPDLRDANAQGGGGTSSESSRSR